MKSILKRDIVGLGVWFSDTGEICNYSDMRKDPQTSYSVIDPDAVDKKLVEKPQEK